MNFDQLDHIGVAVRDIEKAHNFLKENFEANIIHEIVSVEKGFQTALVSLGELKLAEFINQRGEGIHHLSFQVEDLRSTVSFLEEKGLKTIKQPSEIPGIHTIFLHPKSFLGILVELFQRFDESSV